jgi:hypothetical protein
MQKRGLKVEFIWWQQWYLNDFYSQTPKGEKKTLIYFYFWQITLFKKKSKWSKEFCTINLPPKYWIPGYTIFKFLRSNKQTHTYMEDHSFWLCVPSCNVPSALEGRIFVEIIMDIGSEWWWLTGGFWLQENL